MKNNLRWLGGLVGVAFLGACATTSIHQLKAEPGFTSKQVHKVLIVSVTDKPDLRRAIENEFVQQWKDYKVEAAASHVALPADTPFEKTRIASFAQSQGFDSVLVTRLLGVQGIDPQIGNQQPYDIYESTTSENLSQYFDAVAASPAYAGEYQLAAVTANLYTVSTQKKVWSATTQTLLSQDRLTRVREYVKVILNNLYKSQ